LVTIAAIKEKKCYITAKQLLLLYSQYQKSVKALTGFNQRSDRPNKTPTATFLFSSSFSEWQTCPKCQAAKRQINGFIAKTAYQTSSHQKTANTAALQRPIQGGIFSASHNPDQYINGALCENNGDPVFPITGTMKKRFK
jgi:hypothetical protein